MNELVAELEMKIDARVSERALVGFQRVMEAIGEATEVEVRRR